MVIENHHDRFYAVLTSNRALSLLMKTDSLKMFLAYELWDEGGRYAITVSSDETVFVETIKSLQNGVYILKVITIDKTLKGYLYL